MNKCVEEEWYLHEKVKLKQKNEKRHRNKGLQEECQINMKLKKKSNKKTYK